MQGLFWRLCRPRRIQRPAPAPIPPANCIGAAASLQAGGSLIAGLLPEEIVGANGTAAPLMMKNFQAVCRRRHRKIPG